MAEEAPAFRAAANRSLAQLGLAGDWVDVRLGASVLTVADSTGRRVDIPLDAFDRARFGYDTGRLGVRTYDMRLWTGRAPRPLLFRHSGRYSMGGYAAVARGLAAAVAAREASAPSRAGSAGYLRSSTPGSSWGSSATPPGRRSRACAKGSPCGSCSPSRSSC
ncbi:MAG TPA: hypothetical protein VGC56_05035 [Allosphingosinicella sp.]|jgi:hypothetical protein